MSQGAFQGMQHPTSHAGEMKDYPTVEIVQDAGHHPEAQAQVGGLIRSVSQFCFKGETSQF